VSERWPRARGARGFSLIEVLIVVLVMGIVLGVTGSLLGGFYNMFQATGDQSSARMRAQAVFNILSVPIQGAGIGIPSGDMKIPFTFDEIDGKKVEFAMSGWNAPVFISPDTDTTSGDYLRVIYGIPTGLKYVADEEIDLGVEPRADIKHGSVVKLEPTARLNTARQIGNKGFSKITGTPKIDPYDITAVDVSGTSPVEGISSALVVFPGTDMMPAAVDEMGPSGVVKFYTQPLHYYPPLNANEAAHKVEPEDGNRSKRANKIRPNHDIFLLRGAWAYVDKIGGDSVFCFLNAYNKNAANPLSPSDNAFSGFMIEGIAGIWFETASAVGDRWRYVSVEVLAEGDTMDEGRDASSMAALKSKWGSRGLTLEDGVFYEEFSRVFRPRNLIR
jgi:prepilin-type N-terminal cleavage/methylation domain-containing protein